MTRPTQLSHRDRGTLWMGIGASLLGMAMAQCAALGGADLRSAAGMVSFLVGALCLSVLLEEAGGHHLRAAAARLARALTRAAPTLDRVGTTAQ